MIRVILFLIALFYLVRFVVRVLLRSFFVKAMQNGGYTYTAGRNQGARPKAAYSDEEIHVNKPAKEGKIKKPFDPGGEYIDFEEVK